MSQGSLSSIQRGQMSTKFVQEGSKTPQNLSVAKFRNKNGKMKGDTWIFFPDSNTIQNTEGSCLEQHEDKMASFVMLLTI